MIDENTIIPEELLKMTQKQLKKELRVVDQRSRRWVEYCGKIFKVVLKMDNQYIIKRQDGKLLTKDSESFLNYNDFSVEDFNESKLIRLRTLSKNWDLNTIARWARSVVGTYYEKERFDVTVDEDNNIVSAVIYFPEIEITNSSEQSHIMKDIYIKYEFRKDEETVGGFTLKDIGIARSSYSASEIVNGYLFSHVSKDDFDRYSYDFCYGSTDLSKFIRRCLNDDSPIKFFHSLLLNYEEYLKWESLEGVPYRTIDSVISNNPKFVECGVSISRSSLLKYAEIVLSNIDSFKYEYIIKNGKYVIRATDEFIENVGDIICNHAEPKHIFPFINGKSCSISNEIVETLHYYQFIETKIIFKGEKQRIDIYDMDEVLSINDDELIEKRIHTNIPKMVADFICKQFGNFIINKKFNG